MKRSILTSLLAVVLVCIARADSRMWPPGPYSIMSDQGAVVTRFIPKIEGDKVVATRVMVFKFDASAARYVVSLDREIRDFLEPTYAFQAKDPNVLIFVFCRPDLALAVMNTVSQKILVSKKFQDLVPEFLELDYRDRSMSSLQWCSHPYVSEGKLYLLGGVFAGDDEKRGPSFVVDLASYQIERRKE